MLNIVKHSKSLGINSFLVLWILFYSIFREHSFRYTFCFSCWMIVVVVTWFFFYFWFSLWPRRQFGVNELFSIPKSQIKSYSTSFNFKIKTEATPPPTTKMNCIFQHGNNVANIKWFLAFYTNFPSYGFHTSSIVKIIKCENTKTKHIFNFKLMWTPFDIQFSPFSFAFAFDFCFTFFILFLLLRLRHVYDTFFFF